MAVDCSSISGTRSPKPSVPVPPTLSRTAASITSTPPSPLVHVERGVAPEGPGPKVFPCARTFEPCRGRECALDGAVLRAQASPPFPPETSTLVGLERLVMRTFVPGPERPFA